MDMLSELSAKVFVFGRGLRAVLETLMFRTQTRRWAKVAVAGPPPWDSRNEKIAGFIPANSSVLDLGCGAQTLNLYLASGCEYQPCDLIKSSPNVIVCDFNAGKYPNVDKKYTHVVCSGVLEYVRDYERFLKECALLGNTIIISYSTCRPGHSKLQRLANHWINHLSVSRLEEVFEKAGLSGECLCASETGEVIYRLSSEL